MNESGLASGALVVTLALVEAASAALYLRGTTRPAYGVAAAGPFLFLVVTIRAMIAARSIGQMRPLEVVTLAAEAGILLACVAGWRLRTRGWLFIGVWTANLVTLALFFYLAFVFRVF